MSTVMMKCPRDFVLRSTQGHTVIFKANVPTPVPDALYTEALSRNIVPVKGPIDTDAPAAGNNRIALTGPLRDALIYYAISELKARNNVEDWDGGGNPKTDAIKDLIGVTLSSQERTKYWDNFRELEGNNIEFPSHPNLGLVLELQSLTTRKQLEEFAAEHKIEIKAQAGKQPREIKAFLIGSMVNFQQSPVVAPDPANPETLEAD